MSDLEFDVLDELYFVISFDDLCKRSGYTEEEVKSALCSLLEKQFVKILVHPDEELINVAELDTNQIPQYYYLATKAGLKAHNGFES